MRTKQILLGLGLTAVAFLILVYTLFPPIEPNSIRRLASFQNAFLLDKAWALPVARHYLSGDFVYQSNPSVCGPTSIADLLRSEGNRANADDMLTGTNIHTFLGYLPLGLTLDQEAAVLHLRTKRQVMILRGLSLADFRAQIARSNDPARRYIINFTRKTLFGQGHGHFSPVLGYLAKQDLVFVGDVNSDYKPWLVPTARLFAAQDGVDPHSGAKRGLLWVSTF